MGTRSSSILIAVFLVADVATPVDARAAAVAAPADDDYVRRVVGRAAALVNERRYDAALDVLDRAHRERPHAVFVYVQATIEEQRGDCTRALARYREFLALDIAEADAEDARRGEERCQQALAPQEAPAEIEVPPSPDPPPREDPPSERPGAAEPPAAPGGDDRASLTPPRWQADVAGGVLAGAGLAGLGAGVGVFARGRVDARTAEDVQSLQSYEDQVQRAIRLNQAGVVTMALGSALIVAGVVRYAVVASRARRGAPEGSRIQAKRTWGALCLRF